mmetsp:Transcript_32620/g.49881  ORF Transcript_32620/g.49881 Transcript_32620/m.49881 type:complete len:90 (+) Transcript_32620:1731-2000(+)
MQSIAYDEDDEEEANEPYALPPAEGLKLQNQPFLDKEPSPHKGQASYEEKGDEEDEEEIKNEDQASDDFDKVAQAIRQTEGTSADQSLP